MNALNQQCLVLNANFMPLVTCSVRRAIILSYQGKAKVIEYDEQHEICSPSISMQIPLVITLLSHIHLPTKRIQLNKKNILVRDNYTCQYCGKKGKNLTVDHILPKSRDGKDTWENQIASCQPCNNSKGDRTPEEAHMSFISNKKPAEPSLFMMIQIRLNNMKNSDKWQRYMFMSS